MGNYPSYIWLSIIHGRDLLHRGLRRRIGNGDNVRAFHDAWLPIPELFKPITPLCFLSEQVRVSNLIIHWQWRKDLVEVLFCDRDKETILSIPLCPTGGEDTSIWHYTPKEIFTVSSAYKIDF